MQDRPTQPEKPLARLIAEGEELDRRIEAADQRIKEGWRNLEQLVDDQSDTIKGLMRRVEELQSAFEWAVYAANLKGPHLVQAIRGMDGEVARRNQDALRLIHNFSAELVSVTAPLINPPAHDHEDGQREAVLKVRKL